MILYASPFSLPSRRPHWESSLEKLRKCQKRHSGRWSCWIPHRCWSCHAPWCHPSHRSPGRCPRPMLSAKVWSPLRFSSCTLADPQNAHMAAPVCSIQHTNVYSRYIIFLQSPFHGNDVTCFAPSSDRKSPPSHCQPQVHAGVVLLKTIAQVSLKPSP